MRLGLLVLGGWALLYGQSCVPTSILPGDTVSAALDSTSCTLSDGTAYAGYSLTLPVRGQLQVKLTPTDGSVNVMLRDATAAQLAAGTAIQQPVEAGTYTIVINGIQAGTAPQYTVQPLFTAEPSMWCTAFPNLGLNQTIGGSLGSAGCMAPDGTPYDAYWVNTLGAGTLAVSVANINALLSVRDQAGNVIATGSNNVSAPVMDGSQYQVVVALADNPGSYQVTTSFQAAATETCVPQKTFSNPGSDTAAVTAASCSTSLDGSGDLQFYNYYLLTVPAAGLLDINATTRDFHPTLYLFDAAGNQLALDAEGGGTGNSEIRLQVPAGTYLAQLVSDAASGGGNYSFTYGFTAGTPQACQTAQISVPPSAVSGTLSPASCRTGLGLSDLYTITLPAAGVLSANVTTTSFTPQMAIRDAKDNLIVWNEDVEGLGAASVSALLPAGTYTIVPAAASGSGAYQLTPAFTAQTIPSCGSVQSLSLSHAAQQFLGGSGCFAANGEPADFYQFTLNTDSTVAAIMTSTDLAGFLSLTDSNGNVLRSDTDSYNYNDPMIVQYLKAGTYQLMARAASAGSAGLYQVSLLGAAGPRPPFCAPLAPLSSGTINGTLNYTSCQYVDATFADVYELTMPSGGAVDLKLNTTDFDPYLILLDAKGGVLAQADDGGGGTTSHLTQTLAAGTYFLVVKPFTGYDSVGNYQLTMQ